MANGGGGSHQLAKYQPPGGWRNGENESSLKKKKEMAKAIETSM